MQQRNTITNHSNQTTDGNNINNNNWLHLRLINLPTTTSSSNGIHHLLLKAMDTINLFHNSNNSKGMDGSLCNDLVCGNPITFHHPLLLKILIITSNNNNKISSSSMYEEMLEEDKQRIIMDLQQNNNECIDNLRSSNNNNKEQKRVVAVAVVLQQIELNEIYSVSGVYKNNLNNSIIQLQAIIRLEEDSLLCLLLQYHRHPPPLR